jgi:hypothetical protein
MTATRFYAAPDVDTEKFANALRQLADKAESGDAPVIKLKMGREMIVEDNCNLTMELKVAEPINSDLSEQWFDVYEDDTE